MTCFELSSLSRSKNRQEKRGSIRKLRNNFWPGKHKKATEIPSLAIADEKQKILTLEYAQKLAGKAEAYGKKKNWKLSIAIVNSEGNLLYFQRDTEAYSGSIEASIQKARSSNAFQRPTSAFVDAVKQGRIGMIGVKDVVALEGGVPIVINGKHFGAIGVSGAKAIEDEETAKAALE